MKLLSVWVLFSSMLSFVIVLNAHKVIPVGESTAKHIVVATELNILEQLLDTKPINDDVIQSLINEKRKPYKGAVINSQIEAMPASLLYMALLILSILNILIVLLSVWLIKHRPAK